MSHVIFIPDSCHVDFHTENTSPHVQRNARMAVVKFATLISDCRDPKTMRQYADQLEFPDRDYGRNAPRFLEMTQEDLYEYLYEHGLTRTMYNKLTHTSKGYELEFHLTIAPWGEILAALLRGFAQYLEKTDVCT